MERWESSRRMSVEVAECNVWIVSGAVWPFYRMIRGKRASVQAWHAWGTERGDASHRYDGRVCLLLDRARDGEPEVVVRGSGIVPTDGEQGRIPTRHRGRLLKPHQQRIHPIQARCASRSDPKHVTGGSMRADGGYVRFFGVGLGRVGTLTVKLAALVRRRRDMNLQAKIEGWSGGQY